MSDKEDFERHVPVHPLPDEIQQMGTDDTVCKFCGVSYLIHREIKKLEDRIKNLEVDLQDYESLKTKETQFRQLSSEQYLKIQDLDEKLSTRIQMISSLNTDIESKDLEISRLKKISYEAENDNNQISVECEKLKKKLLIYDSVVMATKISISEQKSQLKRLELDAKDQKVLIGQYVQHINNQVEKYTVKNQRETQNQSEDLSLLKIQINQLIKDKASNEEQMDFYKKQIESFQVAKKEMNSQNGILNDELNKLKKLNSKSFDLEKENRTLLEQMSDLKNEITNLKFKLDDAHAETNEFKQKINSFQGNLSQAKSAYELELKLKNDSIFKAKNELDSIKKRYEEKDKFEKEILNNHQINLHEVTNLKYEIKNLNDRLGDHENERNSMILAHQCQITQLKDSFREKLRNAEIDPEKIAEELNKERDRNQLELQKLTSDLNQNFKMEFDIQEQKYNEMYAKYQQISKEFEGNSKTRISDLENENKRLSIEMKHLQQDKTNIEKKLKKELEDLRAITKELHGRLEKYTDDDDFDGVAGLKKEITQKNGTISDLESRLKEFENQLNAAKDEARILQETVHNECLERHELHEKLDEARDELLELKKNAYSSQQLIPLKGSLNKNNLSTFKNGTGLIDVNNPPENYPKAYPKSLNEMQNTSLNKNESHLNSTRNRKNSATVSNSTSEKSSAESSAKVVEPFDRHKAMNLMSQKYPSEPVQLFKKLNEISNDKKNTSNRTLSDNKKRISLLLARK